MGISAEYVFLFRGSSKLIGGRAVVLPPTVGADRRLFGAQVLPDSEMDTMLYRFSDSSESESDNGGDASPTAGWQLCSSGRQTHGRIQDPSKRHESHRRPGHPSGSRAKAPNWGWHGEHHPGVAPPHARVRMQTMLGRTGVNPLPIPCSDLCTRGSTF